MVLTPSLPGIQRRGFWVVEKGFMKAVAFDWDPDGKGNIPGKENPRRKITKGAVTMEGGKVQRAWLSRTGCEFRKNKKKVGGAKP